jgi:GTP pyrophosphokinase
VEILTASTLRVQPELVRFTTTAKARNKVEAVLRRMKRERQKKGEELMEEWCAQHDTEMTSQLVDDLCLVHQRASREELFEQIGAGTIVLDDNDVEELQRLKRKGGKGWRKFIPFLRSNKNAVTPAAEAPAEEVKIDRKKPLILNEENMSRYTMCPHCHPIPGDQVLGYLDSQNRVIIHKLKCPIADKLKSSDGNHILSAKWDTHKLLEFKTIIHIEGFDRVGIIKSLADVVTQQLNVNVHRLCIEARGDLFVGDIELSVHDTSDVETIIKNLKKIAGVVEVTRVS